MLTPRFPGDDRSCLPDHLPYPYGKPMSDKAARVIAKMLLAGWEEIQAIATEKKDDREGKKQG